MFIRTKDTEIFGLFSDSRNVDTIMLPVIFVAIMGSVLLCGWLAFS